MSPTRRTWRWPASSTVPLSSPIQPSVVYTAADPDALDSVYEDGTPGFTYAREGHPNATVLAERIAALEEVGQGIVTGSGMSAVTAVLLGVLSRGDHVVGGDQLYGRSLRLLSEDLPRLGIETGLADPTRIESVAAALRANTRMIFVETVSNPTIRVADLAGLAALARERGLLLAVDNTFTTPRGLRPTALGADIVIHSVTKLLAGHSDATLGWVGTRSPDLMERIEGVAVTMGLTASPFDCWLAERGLLSFEVRYDRAEATASQLSDMLAAHPAVQRVLYPTRPDHPDANHGRRLLGNRGSHIVSFGIEASRARANALVRALGGKVAFAPTLGDICTTLSHPASSSHRGLGADERATIGIDEGFFRVSVGCEAADEICGAFKAALDATEAG